MRNKILNQLDTAWAGRTCLCFDSLESTNDHAKELAKREPVHGSLILTEMQTAGRGRRGRSWQSEPGSTICMSLCTEPGFTPEHAAGLTLVMALSAAEAIRDVTGAVPQIKWPNDIVMGGKKICGILTELIFTERGYTVIIGVGINVNTSSFPKEIEGIASSLKLETGKETERERLIAAMMRRFETNYEVYERTADFSLLKESYERMLVNRGSSVRVLDPKGAYDGVAEGISAVGNLIVVCEDGTKKEIDSGEVSVRGLYGYV